ncbi:HTTM domain-containing protein [Fulvivirgaceae bacterium BMA10]|uniref:HTTM domain-containing protein n=1 Tax=Splendidivirga corallicola TaxID=3051826 RepID=A0ABT8KNH0_9BACT|nr:HTTM domain-containing protein [Fulvivirgaceae bacterium BMA10]
MTIDRSISIKRFLFQEVDNSGLIVFRVIFGLLIFLESAGAIFTGWVHETMIEPSFTFTFIGLEWLQPLPGNGMYYYYAVMAVFGLMVMLGWFYHLGISGFTILWTASYLMQKSHYNNHYYLLILLCFFMMLVPANRFYSLDVRRNPGLKKLTCPRWCYTIFQAQLGIVFTYAALAKVYPDWLNFLPIKIWFNNRSTLPVIGPLLKQEWLFPIVAYGGILFDLLITPMLLWKRTRILGLILSLVFHGFNSAVFHIGIFPYLMIGSTVLFFEPERIRSLFFKSKPIPQLKIHESVNLELKQKKLLIVLSIYFIIQLWLPLRHHFYEGNTFWTEEGHRMSWRMMLRTKWGHVQFNIKNPATGEEWIVHPQEFLTNNQSQKIAKNPDMIWQFVQYLKEHYEGVGKPGVEIYAHGSISLNGRDHRPFIDPNVDLTKVKWQRFKHSDWIMDFSDF